MIQFSYTFYRCGVHDIMSSPGHYFDLNLSPVHVDFRSYTSGNVVFGGGGLIADGFDPAFQKAIACGATRVIWGAGSDYSHQTNPVYPGWVKDFDLVGLRDFGNPYGYVPCASCMHPIFMEYAEYPETNGVLAVDHFNRKLPIANSDVDVWMDYPMWGHFHRLIQAIAAAELIVTRSYHVCYYGALLRKKVVCIKPWSSKFYGLKHPPTFCNDASEWVAAGRLAQRAPVGYLQECRQINTEFSEKVKALLAKPI